MSDNIEKISYDKRAIDYLGQEARNKKKRSIAHAIVSEGASKAPFKISTTNANGRYPQTNRYPTTGHGRYNNMIENSAERDTELKKVIASSNTSHTYNYHKNEHISHNNRNDYYDHAKLAQVQRDILFKGLSIEEKNKLLGLVESGAITYKNGKYHTNTKTYKRYLEKLEAKQRNFDYDIEKKIKNDEVDRKTKSIGLRIANFFGISNVNTRLIRKLVSKKYDRDKMKDIKTRYKNHSKIKKWEKKYGKL